jgi:NADPH-dependent curcumin reductase CurA
VTLRGFIVRDHEDLRAEFEQRVTGWLTAGALRDEHTEFDGIDAAPEAMVRMLDGANLGKALVRLAPPPVEATT